MGRHLQPKKPHGSGASASGGPKNHLHLDLLGGELDQKLAGSPMAKNWMVGAGNTEFIKLNYRLL